MLKNFNHNPSRPQLRVGLISDLHADLARLDAALSVLETRQVDRVVCLGDVVEKGNEAAAVVGRLRRWCIPTVQGNHDLNAVRHAELEGSADDLDPADLDWLKGLPASRCYLWAGIFVGMAHASPVSQCEAVSRGQVSKAARRAFARSGQDVWLVGHTHVPDLFHVGQTLIVNPGSVYFGRSAEGPSCAVLCLPSMHVEFYRVPSGEPFELER